MSKEQPQTHYTLMSDRPGGKLAKRPLQFIWLVDYSGSMAGNKIESLNYAIREVIPEMQRVADENPNAEILVRAIKFSSGAQWHVETPTDIHNFQWPELVASEVTDMGAALKLAAEALSMERMPARGLPPVLVLLSDGLPTDDFDEGLKALLAEPWGQKAIRISIAIGDGDINTLQKFIGNDEVKVLTADNAQDLVNKIKWASTVPLKAASNPASRTTADTGNTPLPPAPEDTPPINAADVF